MVQRYGDYTNIDIDGDSYINPCPKSNNGEYVLYDDFRKLLKAYGDLVGCSGVECPTIDEIIKYGDSY